MRKTLIILIFILFILLIARDVRAGIIIRPVHNLGLVGYWDFQEGAGLTAYDKSGQGYDGSLESMATSSNGGWADGKIGKALDFDGLDDRVRIPLKSDSFMTMTVSIWFKADAEGGDGEMFVWGQDVLGSGDNYFAINQVSSVLRFWADCSNRGTISVGADNWYHAVATRDENEKWVFYVNGEITGTYIDSDVSCRQARPVIWLGQGFQGYFDGLIDEVRVYNRALSESEIERLYKLSSPKIGINKLGLVDPQLPSNATISYVREDCSGYSRCSTSLSAWQTYMLSGGGIDWGACDQGDLTCISKVAVAQIEGTWDEPSTTGITITGWTTDTNNYIKIYTTTEARHNGTWGNGFRIWVTGGVNGLLIYEENVRIDGLSVKTGTGRPYFVANSTGSGEVHISNCFGEVTGSTWYKVFDIYDVGALIVKIWNNIGINHSDTAGGHAFYLNDADATGYFYNNTGITNNGRAFSRDAGTGIIINNIGISKLNYDFFGTWATANYNVSSDDTADNWGGAGNRINQKVNFINAANYDFHLSPGDGGARGYGADLSNDANISFSTDIDRQPRGAKWDIGADQARGTVVGASQAKQVSDGLVGYWSFNGPDISGTDAFDRSGQGNHGVISGATKTIGKVGQGLSFDGVDDRAVVPHNETLNMTGPITISLWLYPRSLVSSYTAFIEKGTYTSSYYFGTHSGAGNRKLSFWYGGTDVATTDTDALNLNEWQHVAVSYTGFGADLYINGVNVKHSDTTATVSGNSSVLDIAWRGSSPYFDGKIDEVRLYNRALEPWEIQRLYNLGR